MRAPAPDAVVALGCNVGPRRSTLDLACRGLERRGIRVLARSRLYWSRPWGVTDQPDFLNAAIAVRAGLRPLALLHRLMDVERSLGRRRNRHWGPRRLDLDLLLLRDLRCNSTLLQLPHPGMLERDFVLWPLIDLGAPYPIGFPGTGWRERLSRIPAGERTIHHIGPWISP